MVWPLTLSAAMPVGASTATFLRVVFLNNWSKVDLLATLSTGITNGKISLTANDRLIMQTEDQFVEYIVDQTGFIENGISKKPFKTVPSSNLYVNGEYMFSGDQEGCIRGYQMTA